MGNIETAWQVAPCWRAGVGGTDVPGQRGATRRRDLAHGVECIPASGLGRMVVKDVHPRMQGRCFVTRFADDFIIGFELEADARRVMEVLPRRFARFRLTIHPEKTVLTAFKRPPSRNQSAGGKGTFDFLGFTHYWAKTRRGYWVIKRKTVGKRLRRFMKGIWTWCRENRHAPLQEQYQTLSLKLRGYYQYYGIRGNFKMLEVVFEQTERAWQYWLSRRSHKGHITWQKFVDAVHRKLPLRNPGSFTTSSRGWDSKVMRQTGVACLVSHEQQLVGYRGTG